MIYSKSLLGVFTRHAGGSWASSNPLGFLKRQDLVDKILVRKRPGFGGQDPRTKNPREEI